MTFSLARTRKYRKCHQIRNANVFGGSADDHVAQINNVSDADATVVIIIILSRSLALSVCANILFTHAERRPARGGLSTDDTPLGARTHPRSPRLKRFNDFWALVVTSVR